tara:strand:+ start:712 stop:1269 length:558 start_codon:yes stop_codon:yes gene_type:complete
MTDTHKWYYKVDNKQRGPVSISTLSDLLAVSEIASNTHVRKSELDNWLPMSSVPELASEFNIQLTPPPLPNEISAQSRENTTQFANENTEKSNSSKPKTLHLLTACFAFGAWAALLDGEFYSVVNGIGYAIGAGLSFLAFVYIFAGIPMLIYWVVKRKRAPFEGKLVWGTSIVLAVLLTAAFATN